MDERREWVSMGLWVVEWAGKVWWVGDAVVGRVKSRPVVDPGVVGDDDRRASIDLRMVEISRRSFSFSLSSGSSEMEAGPLSIMVAAVADERTATAISGLPLDKIANAVRMASLSCSGNSASMIH